MMTRATTALWCFMVSTNAEVAAQTVRLDGSRAILSDVSPNQVLVVTPPVFRRGDANSDGAVDISDALGILETLFSGDLETPCRDAADANDDTKIDISDSIFVLRMLFLVRTGFPAPGAETCGADVTADDLGCPSYPPCDDG